MTRAVLCALILVLAAACPGVAADEIRITNASNVRLRAAPATDAPIVRELQLGAELTVIADSDGAEPWYHVRTSDSRDGWVFGALTTALDPARRDQIVESIVEARLGNSAEFSAGVQLVAFIERNASRLKDRDARGRFALYRLRALSAVFRTVPFRVGERDVESKLSQAEPYGTWIREHLDAARHDELNGVWKVDPEYVQTVHRSHSGTNAADEIAWFYVRNGLFGECEGYMSCYIAWQDKLSGWYLKSHPRGRHVDESTAFVVRYLNDVMDLFEKPKPGIIKPKLESSTDCDELRASLDSLAAAVTGSSATNKPAAITALNRYAPLCK